MVGAACDAVLLLPQAGRNAPDAVNPKASESGAGGEGLTYVCDQLPALGA